MNNLFKYEDAAKRDGYRVKKIKCLKCYGTRHYSGRYGQTACDECNNGYVYKRIKIYKIKVIRDEEDKPPKKRGGCDVC